MRKLEEGMYKHFKGNYYYVHDVNVNHTETGENLVYYTAQYGNYKSYVRPYEMFISEVDKIKYPNAQQKYRFERVKFYIECEGKYLDYYDELTDDIKDAKEYYSYEDAYNEIHPSEEMIELGYYHFNSIYSRCKVKEVFINLDE